MQAAESEPQQEAQYAYHLGDTVYMGADEYEILAFDDKQVRLFDTQFPLFNKEMDRAEFDRRVRENPMNDHLKVKELPSEEKTDKAPAFDIGMGYLGNGLTVWNRAVEENGDYQTIVEGVSETSFAPDAEITREQLAAILHRYAGEPATAANLAGYADGASVGAYAADAMSWCVEHMIITGTTGDTLAPQGTATRAQAAAMLMRFVER